MGIVLRDIVGWMLNGWMLVCRPYTGDPNDTSLMELIPFLQSVVNLKYDARKVLPKWAGPDDVGKVGGWVLTRPPFCISSR
jgi:hypothetical protein